MKNAPEVKKQWSVPKLILIATSEIENKSQPNWHEKTFVSSKILKTPTGTFNQLFFKNGPGGGIVGFNTENAYVS